ncbi:MAG TPA: hypothetical protein VGY77_03375, partial [Gemmataceae bacterium]|nr:hypothetical protein [Gemmataceae bacterium]
SFFVFAGYLVELVIGPCALCPEQNGDFGPVKGGRQKAKGGRRKAIVNCFVRSVKGKKPWGRGSRQLFWGVRHT